MARCLVGIAILAAGLVVLAAAVKESRPSEPSPGSSRGKWPRRKEALAFLGARRTLMLPAPPFQIRFSCN